MTSPSSRGAATLSSKNGLCCRHCRSCCYMACILLLMLYSATSVAAARNMKQDKKVKTSDNDNDNKNDDNTIPGVNFLVEAIGRELYATVKRPKYKFMIYMTIGKLPDEQSTVIVLNMFCNLLYGVGILVGFLVLPRGYMLIGTISTLFVGPALVLVLLGSFFLMLGAFTFYPVISVLGMWVFFFLTSHVAQVLGRRLGLDHDGDGDVDLLDILSYCASTRWGKFLGLPRLHQMLNDAARDPFVEINRRLDQIQASTTAALGSTKND